MILDRLNQKPAIEYNWQGGDRGRDFLLEGCPQGEVGVGARPDEGRRLGSWPGGTSIEKACRG
jgi:hypothetical protein